ncbi:3 beta-hydroxysteroid dehydrogenase/delta 5--_4-isomerase [mine drainage metagenome]|jgi:nucleoside-diphosphate-sugar epimerase|uniref:3 beta-hydroxysteroid dehydrogenase/delta 5-->4-isomerase n=1 Tax=mine drainage metagenome TaxID=410659 RepID=A0A1J5SAN5_9ZZZZ
MILVTGASGLLGSHLVQELVKQDKKVRAIYRNDIPANMPDGIDWVKADILDPLSLEDAMKGVEQVYHCAAMVSFNPKKKEILYKTNVEGTANIVNACLNADIKKLLFVSSVAALGKTKGAKLIDEKMNWTEDGDNSEYGKTKYLAEKEVWRGIAEGLNTVIVNPVIILGAGDWEKGSSEIFKSAYNQFPWYSTGASGFVDVKDVVRAMILLMQGTPHNERFIICAQNLSFKEVFSGIAKSFHKRLPFLKVTPFLANIVWRLEAIKASITGNEPLLTKETARSALSIAKFNNAKFLTYAPNFDYTPINVSIERICEELKIKYHL